MYVLKRNRQIVITLHVHCISCVGRGEGGGQGRCRCTVNEGKFAWKYLFGQFYTLVFQFATACFILLFPTGFLCRRTSGNCKEL